MAKKRTTKTTGKAAPQKTVVRAIQPKNSFWTNQQLHRILIFLSAFLLYGNTITHDYAQDDAIVIQNNDYTQNGFAGIGDILGHDTFLGFFKQKKSLVAGGRYRPFSLVTFAMEYQLFGLNPTVSHLVNVLLYGLTGILLYMVLLQLFNHNSNPLNQKGFFIALAATALFMTHPIHTEAVANIKGRDEILCLLGSLGALYFVLKYHYKNNVLNLVWASLAYFVALMSKENAITYLAVIPLALYFFTKADFKKTITTTLPLLGVAAVFLLIRYSVLQADGALGDGQPVMELMNNPFLKWTGTQYVELPLGEKLATIIYTLGKYIQLLFVPYPLTHDYYPRHIDIMSFGDWQVILSTLLYVGLGIYALIRLPKRDPVAFGIIYFIATISVISNIVFPIGTNMSERFMFMPSFGFTLIIAYLLAKYFPHNKVKKAVNLKVLTPILGVVLVLFTIQTFTRNFAWKDNYTLFATDIQTSINSAKLNNAMGGETTAKAILPENTAQQQAMLQQAIGYLNKATTTHPMYANSWVLLGNAHLHLGQYAKAIEYYDYVIGITGSGATDHINANNNKGIAYYELGRTLLEQQQFAPSINAFTQALALGKVDAELYGRLGSAYGMTNQPQKAIEMFRKVIEINPNYAQAHLNLGYALRSVGDEATAMIHLQKAVELDPNLRNQIQ